MCIFQVATNVRGRGVLRLLLLQQQLRLLSIPALLLQLGILVFPLWQTPLLLCHLFEIVTFIVITQHIISSITIALGRYWYDSLNILCPKQKNHLFVSDYFIFIRTPWRHTSKRKHFSSISHGFVTHYVGYVYQC